MAQIKTYARLKPTKKPYSGYEINKNVLTVHIPDSKDFLVGSQQTGRSNLSYNIMFTNIFHPEATQEDVFDCVAEGIIQSFLNGYNGTIFAYGQTGTGKTYTVEGNTTRYNTRGLSTRALSMIYQQLEKRTDDHITVCLSYLEIYQEVAYDLLNPISRSSLPLAPFAKVTVVEGPQGSCIFRGLTLHLAANEEIAQMLLLQGQANRKVAETPVNQRSSRSHAVFTVYLQVRKHDSDVLLTSKLHLVDLAGSERVSKTGVDGQQLTEAKSINLSLHHLETVIIALQTDRCSSSNTSGGGEKSKSDYPPAQSKSNTSFVSGPSSDSGSKPYKFVPYRNSLLTMVLKDSLGGNCLTAMIATISMEAENLGESISTCRFAQRVAHISNNARRNEEVDDKTVIKRLKHKVTSLEHQLAVLRAKGKNDSLLEDDILSVLSDEDRTTCAKIMDGFIQGVITDPVDAGIYDQSRFRECLHLLKHQYLHSMSSNSHSVTAQFLQPRQAGAEHLSETSHHLQPNNPHRDSGDHIMSEATQADSSIFASQHRSAVGTSSGVSVNATDDYLLVSEDQVVMPMYTGLDAEKKGPDKKGNNLDEFVEVSNSERHKPQSERQKVKEVMKHGQKLSHLEQEQAVKQEQLAQMSQEILMQELLTAENNLRLKLQVVEEQIVEQHAYLVQLKLNQADPVQITREQLIEQHLLKRQAKFHEKLTKLLDNKAKLKCVLSPGNDPGLLFCAPCNIISLEEKFGQLKQSKVFQGWQTVDCHHKGNIDLQKDSLTGLDREKLMVKPKQLEVKESLDKRELKQKMRMPQQQLEPIFGTNMGQCHSGTDKLQVESLHSIDSNRSLRDTGNCPYGFVNPLLDSSKITSDLDSKHIQGKPYHPLTTTRTGLHHKDNNFSEVAPTDEQQLKLVQDYLIPGYNERLTAEVRQCKYNGSTKGTDMKRPECGSTYILRNSMSPCSHGHNSSTLCHQNLAEGNPIQETGHILLECPNLNEAMPMEIRSFHDPHHSHKFALDDLPAESTSLSKTKVCTADILNNQNNSYMRPPCTYTARSFQILNQNTNANTEICDTDQQLNPAVDCVIISVNFNTTTHVQITALHDSDPVPAQTSKAAMMPDTLDKKLVDHDDGADAEAERSDEKLPETPKHCNVSANWARATCCYSLSCRSAEAALPLIIHEYILQWGPHLMFSHFIRLDTSW